MVILRPTQKLRAQLPTTTSTSQRSDTALGDWYVNRLVVYRQPLLLLVSSISLLPIVIPARDVRSLPSRLAQIVAARLQRRYIAPDIIAKETQAMSPVVVEPTIDRSIRGIMVDFAKAIPYDFDPTNPEEVACWFVEERLAQTPCFASRPYDQTVFPNDKSESVLLSKWRPN